MSSASTRAACIAWRTGSGAQRRRERSRPGVRARRDAPGPRLRRPRAGDAGRMARRLPRRRRPRRIGSARRPQGLPVPTYVADMVTLLARLDAKTVHWFGTSMGGLIGIGLAGLPGSPISRLVLNDVGPTIDAAGHRAHRRVHRQAAHLVERGRGGRLPADDLARLRAAHARRMDGADAADAAARGGSLAAALRPGDRRAAARRHAGSGRCGRSGALGGVRPDRMPDAAAARCRLRRARAGDRSRRWQRAARRRACTSSPASATRRRSSLPTRSPSCGSSCRAVRHERTARRENRVGCGGRPRRSFACSIRATVASVGDERRARARVRGAAASSAASCRRGEGVLAHADGVAAILAAIGAAPPLLRRRVPRLRGRRARRARRGADAAVRRVAGGARRPRAKARRAAAHRAGRAPRRRRAQADRSSACARCCSRSRSDLRVVLLRLASRLQTLRFFAATKLPCPPDLAAEAMQVFAPLANRLGIWQIKWELEDLAFRFLDPDAVPDDRRGCSTSGVPTARRASPPCARAWPPISPRRAARRRCRGGRSTSTASGTRCAGRA